VFVADTLAAWLIGLLADAGRKKLTTFVLGSEQERALQSAATRAAQFTAVELRPGDDDRASQLALVINQVFGGAAPDVPLAGDATVLEVLRAGIAGRIAVLDDASLTGTGLSSADLLAVPAMVVAAKLTGHLLREIMVRGSQGGALFPLAVQLGQDVTHLQGQRIEGMLAQLLDEVRATPAPAGIATQSVGWPLVEVRDPFALEVHHPVEPDVPESGLPVLPVYVPREHDTALAEVVMAATAGASGIAVLVGGSSTGKTRACWQALELLRGLEPGWRLWHPIDPSRPAAALAQLPDIGPRTVVWLNEAQYYLGPADGTGERVAAGLRDLLRERARGPVLLLATLWPRFWDALTDRPPGDADPHAHARELLTGHNIQVPSAFTPAQLRELQQARDPRLTQAAAKSRDGQVIQYLAGARELLDRYRTASSTAQALIHTAMDARRLGMRPALPRAFLEAAATGYLSDGDWDLLDEDWLGQALGSTAKPAKGLRGPLTPIRSRPAPGALASTGNGSAWQLADYLDQHGRRTRREEIPPASFWAAATSCADPADLSILGKAAYGRGLYRDAARLYKQASAYGDPVAGARLIDLLHALHPDDRRPANWAATNASPDDPGGLGELLDALRQVGATGQVATILHRDPATHVSLDDPSGLARLLDALRQAGATGQAATLARRASAAHVSLDDPHGLARRFRALPEAEAHALARRAAAHVSLDDPGAVVRLLYQLPAAEAAALARRAAAHVSLDNSFAVAELLIRLEWAGAQEQAAALLDRDPAAHVSLDDPGGLARLLDALRETGAIGQVAALLDRDPAARVSLDDPEFVSGLLDALRRAGAASQITTLATRAAAHASLDHPKGVAWLLRALRQARAQAQAARLIQRLPAAGMFQLFCEQEGHEKQFRFGREPDGRPAAPWAWTDLG
jgi:hypothetical protein